MRKTIIEKTLIVSTMMLLIAVTGVSGAGQYTFDIEQDLTDELVAGKNNSAGSIIIKPEYQPETVPFNGSTIEINEDDRVQNAMGQEIRITSTTLLAGETITLADTGSFDVRNSSDHLLGLIHVGTAEPIKINITDDEQFITAYDGLHSVTSPKRVNISILVSAEYNGQTSQWQYFVNNQSHSHEYQIQKQPDFKILQKQCQQQIRLQDDGTWCNITIQNTGSKKLTLTTKVQPNQNIFFTPQTRYFIKETDTLLIQYDTQNTQEVGNQTYNITIIDESGKNTTTQHTTYIQDVTPPHHNEFTIPPLRSQKKANWTVRINDNHKVSNVTAVIRDKNSNLVDDVNVQSLEFNKYSLSWEPNTQGQYTLELIMEDAQGNKNTTNHSIQVTRLDAGSSQSRISYKRHTLSAYSPAKKLITVAEPEIVEVRATKINNSVQLKLIGPENEYILDSENDKAVLLEEGDYKLQVKQNNLGSYSYQLTYAVPKNSNAIDATTITGQTVNYTVPEPFTRTEDNGNGVTCQNIFAGGLNNSRYECTTTIYHDTLPTGSGDHVPVYTGTQREQWQTEWNNTITTAHDKVDFYQNSLLWLFTIVLLFGGGVPTILYLDRNLGVQII